MRSLPVAQLEPSTAIAPPPTRFSLLSLTPSEGESVTPLLEPWQLHGVYSLMVLGVLLLLHWLILRALRAKVDDVRLRYRFKTLTSYALTALGALALITIWSENIEPGQLATYLGFVTAGLAIALRDPLVNLVAWLYISGMRPFKVGDRIEIGGHRGDVVGQDPFAFQMLQLGAEQSTGKVISAPNAMVFLEPVVNHTLEFEYVWFEMPVVVTFESEWRPLREMLLEIADVHVGQTAKEARQALRSSTRLMVDYGTLTPCVYTKAVDHGVQVTLRCLVPARARRIAEDAIWRDLLTRIEATDTLDLAYPTQRFYRLHEGA